MPILATLKNPHRAHDLTVGLFWFCWVPSTNKKVLSNFTIPSFYLPNRFSSKTDYQKFHFSNTLPHNPLLHPTPRLAGFWITSLEEKTRGGVLWLSRPSVEAPSSRLGRAPGFPPRWVDGCYYLNLASGFTSETNGLHGMASALSFALTNPYSQSFVKVTFIKVWLLLQSHLLHSKIHLLRCTTIWILKNVCNPLTPITLGYRKFPSLQTGFFCLLEFRTPPHNPKPW